MPCDTPVLRRGKTFSGGECLPTGRATSANWNLVRSRARELLLQAVRQTLFPSKSPPLLLQNLRPVFLLPLRRCGYCRSGTRTLRANGDTSVGEFQVWARAHRYIVCTF